MDNSIPIELTTTDCETETDTSPHSAVIRRRKRKRNCPKVVKTAQHSPDTPVLKQNNANIEKKIKTQVSNANSSSDEVCSMLHNNLPKDLNDELCEDKTTPEAIKKTMKLEWETCDKIDDYGLLPIQTAVITNDLKKLQRQLYVWTFRKINLNKVRIAKGDNLLQLALKENSITSIINELVEVNLDYKELDENWNSIIHLAISNLTYENEEEQMKMLNTLELLLRKVDLNILLEHNDDGLTALHIAVKKNEFFIVEKILNVVDDILKVESIGRVDQTLPDKQTCLQYYCNQCYDFNGRERCELKDKILNAMDMKSGSTLLHLAMEMGQEHMIYLLMAHMCDPTVKNLAGFDPRSYYSDRGSNPNITACLKKLILAFETENNSFGNEEEGSEAEH